MINLINKQNNNSIEKNFKYNNLWLSSTFSRGLLELIERWDTYDSQGKDTAMIYFIERS